MNDPVESPTMNMFLRLAALMSVLFCIQCTPVALDAPFAADPAQRQQFVNTTIVGTTTKSDLIARWGAPTGGQAIVSGPYQDGLRWSWVSGTNRQGAVVSVQVDGQEIVRSVESVSVVNGQRIPDAAGTPRTTVSPTPSEPPRAQIIDADDDGIGIELECLIFCI
ncbi:hypothetical protein QTO30_03635 [Yoonia sp. GPGPB17]|uniref:hypothetical protein n=1 Tax=Yoonia sp. GPGPB17 TaxID=3026147 RepID=UPI0030BA8AF1